MAKYICNTRATVGIDSAGRNIVEALLFVELGSSDTSAPKDPVHNPSAAASLQPEGISETETLAVGSMIYNVSANAEHVYILGTSGKWIGQKDGTELT